MTGLCANKQGHWWSASWLHTCRYHIPTHSRSAEDRQSFRIWSFTFSLHQQKNHGSDSLSGDGLPPESVRVGGDDRSDRDGPVGDRGSLRQRGDSHLLLLGPVEFLRPAELRLHWVPAVFHHSGTARYTFILSKATQMMKESTSLSHQKNNGWWFLIMPKCNYSHTYSLQNKQVTVAVFDLYTLTELHSISIFDTN